MLVQKKSDMFGLKNYTNNNCQNCGEKGHHVKDCLNPKTSLGVVLYRKIDNVIEYLMICRRNTIGFVEFIRGKYVYSDFEYLCNLFNVMTNNEISLLKSKDFEYLWEYLWMDNKFNNHSMLIKKNRNTAKEKFYKIKNGYNIKDKFVNLETLIEDKNKFYTEQEWGFPKGRRVYNESDYDAAIREFIEETQINISDIKIVGNHKIFSEIYKSYDNVEYKNIYYLAEYIGKNDVSIDPTKKNQYTEVSNINFFKLDVAMEKIRDYSVEKKKILSEINKHIEDQ